MLRTQCGDTGVVRHTTTQNPASLAGQSTYIVSLTKDLVAKLKK